MSSQCGVTGECGVWGECGVRACSVRMRANVASQCVVSVRAKSATPCAATLHLEDCGDSIFCGFPSEHEGRRAIAIADL